jgi:hypothetical protein
MTPAAQLVEEHPFSILSLNPLTPAEEESLRREIESYVVTTLALCPEKAQRSAQLVVNAYSHSSK